ncbi:MAG: peptidoglycan bridge formation glycyltransferase FemA/FemB family protein [Methanosarcina sp.]|uniref:lipid II:glycine glycyltransferase FemX n=1 Tax=Methanosarcina sp. TaxID=2213 RepID=UPI002604BD5B|nr:peptidoglycan bridge formation glycyltransferase FemA/FemB family protein [Methanosarcina sp.]MDD3245957.1 peptidoglycan bridge formation glycyltransferase FemA/FemB family protein [Methanosarcina sp.]MDD4247613.1 peptidoglycan bridge formation glycyltransferase FemA/FemB family protein [Methanosarcina sp.]
MIEITESIDLEKWENFVSNHPEGNIFQTCAMADVYRSTKNYEPISLAAIEPESGVILAVLQAVIIRDAPGFVGSISSRSIINNGPLFVEGKKGLEALEMLLNYYEKFLHNRAIYTQIRNLWDTENSKNTLDSLGYQYEPHLNYLIDLNRPAENIWGDIHKPRRKGINRAEKVGIKVRKIETRDEIKDCYKVIEETYKNVRLPLADISLLESAFDKLSSSGLIDFYLATLEGEVVGSRVVLKYKGMVHDWYAGSKQEINYVNEAVVWHMLSEYAGKEKVFDFGGAGHPDKPYGVREFKKRFGGEEVNYGRYEKIHDRGKKELLNLGFKAYKKLNLARVL